MPRPIDHLVLAVPDLAEAAALYRVLGFTVGGRNRHPWGTVNAIVQLDGAFLELIGLAEDFVPPRAGDPAAPFASAVAAAVARGGGLALVSLASADADADARAFDAAGLGPARRLDFGRSAEAADGTRREVSFSLAFPEVPSLPEAGLFTCRHHRPENFWSPAAQRHANGALRLDGVALAVEAPRRHVAALATVCDAAPSGPPERPSFEGGTGRIAVMMPADVRVRYGEAAGAVQGRFAGFGVVVEALDPVRDALTRAGIAHAEIAGAVVVPPGSAFGTAVAFGPEPGHSHP